MENGLVVRAWLTSQMLSFVGVIYPGNSFFKFFAVVHCVCICTKVNMPQCVEVKAQLVGSLCPHRGSGDRTQEGSSGQLYTWVLVLEAALHGIQVTQCGSGGQTGNNKNSEFIVIKINLQSQESRWFRLPSSQNTSCPLCTAHIISARSAMTMAWGALAQLWGTV